MVLCGNFWDFESIVLPISKPLVRFKARIALRALDICAAKVFRTKNRRDLRRTLSSAILKKYQAFYQVVQGAWLTLI